MVISLIIGSTFGILLILTKRKHRKANRFVGFIVLIMALWQCLVVVNSWGTWDSFQFLYWIPFSNLLAVGPCIYLYTSYRTTQKTPLQWQSVLHFVPLLIEWVLFFGSHSQGTLENYQTYTLLSTRFMMQLMAVTSIGTYSYISIKQLRLFETGENSKETPNNSADLKAITRAILIFASLWGLWLPYALINHFGFNYYMSDYDFYPLYLLIWFYTVWMCVRLFLKAEVVWVEKSRRKNNTKKRISDTLLKQANLLQAQMAKGRYYLNADLTLQSLATELTMNPHALSQTINDALNQRFSDFVNEYRIKAVIEKLNDPQYANITVLGMAYDSGFNSKTTFNRAFKKVTGKTPKEYREQLLNS